MNGGAIASYRKNLDKYHFDDEKTMWFIDDL